VLCYDEKRENRGFIILSSLERHVPHSWLGWVIAVLTFALTTTFMTVLFVAGTRNSWQAARARGIPPSPRYVRWMGRFRRLAQWQRWVLIVLLFGVVITVSMAIEDVVVSLLAGQPNDHFTTVMIGLSLWVAYSITTILNDRDTERWRWYDDISRLPPR
jgi:hypothetical protein